MCRSEAKSNDNPAAPDTSAKPWIIFNLRLYHMNISRLLAKIRIAHDDYHASYVGHTASGDQFFATTPFVPATQGSGREFLAVYIFSSNGDLKKALIDDLGSRYESNSDDPHQLLDLRLQDLGTIKYEDIEGVPTSRVC